jgi:hypothetical protein|tara:strand:- start:4339 stop:4530 length:192 start_codon:yes stop_codon:yes gene_type:complete
MKVGDLVKLSHIDYPQYVNLKGILMEEVFPQKWKVYIKGKMHPYLVHQVSFANHWRTNDSHHR